MSYGANSRLKRPDIMAILNVTPDSFSDGGAFDDVDAALLQARKCVQEGADIIDIGAESTRPGSQSISAEEEITRLLPVLNAITAEVDIPISVDTYKSDVAQIAMENGVAIINDIWGMQRDLEMAAVVARNNAKVIIMHNRFDGADETINILDDMDRWFDVSLDLAKLNGIADDRIILDPGIGFGKTFRQNLKILAHLARLKQRGYPVLMGLSRKRFIGKILNAEIDQRLFGTLSANLHSILDGAEIIRVHDVKPHRDAIDMWLAIDAERS